MACRRSFGWCSIGVAAMAVAVLPEAGFAQPVTFEDAGAFAAPAAPYAQVSVDDGEFWVYGDPPTILNVQWVRFDLAAPVSGDVYLDFTCRNYNALGLTFALYDSVGNLLVADDFEGSFPDGGAPGLSFGSTAERVPWVGSSYRGQDGPLPAGRYWLAIVAGSLAQVTLGPTNWGVSSPVSYPLGYDEGQLFIETSILIGNTTLPPLPPNDACASAIAIGEDAGPVPAWTGTNVGASQDGFSSCYPDLVGMTSKDIWFNYVPSATGWVTMTLSGGAGGAALPILTRYEGGCGSAQVRCAGGGSFLSSVGTRLTFQVTQGVPVLLAASIRAGQWGPLTLNVDLIGPPCDLQTPVGAIPEIEAACGDVQNEGCRASPAAFDLIQLGETVTGSLYNTRSARDYDYYRFSVPSSTTVRVTAAAQLPFDIAIQRLSASSGCPTTTAGSASNESYLALCQSVSFNATLTAGNYTLVIAHDALDEFVCGTGYERYWITLTVPNCEYPVFTSQPAAAQVCPGAAAVFTAAASASTAPVRGWEWAIDSGGPLTWTPLADGAFAAAGTQAVVSGTTSPTLTIANVDAMAAGIVVRATATACGQARSRSAALSIRPPSECTPACPADFNNSGGITVQDIFDFLAAYFAGLPSADFNGVGGITVQDIFDYLAAYFAGCP